MRLFNQASVRVPYGDLPQIRPVHKDFGVLCAVEHLRARHMHRVLQVLALWVGDEHDVCLTGADILEIDKCCVCGERNRKIKEMMPFKRHRTKTQHSVNSLWAIRSPLMEL